MRGKTAQPALILPMSDVQGGMGADLVGSSFCGGSEQRSEGWQGLGSDTFWHVLARFDVFDTGFAARAGEGGENRSEIGPFFKLSRSETFPPTGTARLSTRHSHGVAQDRTTRATQLQPGPLGLTHHRFILFIDIPHRTLGPSSTPQNHALLVSFLMVSEPTRPNPSATGPA
jgi:hypothetical protein